MAPHHWTDLYLFQDNVMGSYVKTEMSNNPQISQHENNLVFTGVSKQQWNDKENVQAFWRNTTFAQFLWTMMCRKNHVPQWKLQAPN